MSSTCCCLVGVLPLAPQVPVFMRNQESGIRVKSFCHFYFFISGIAGFLLLCAGFSSLVVVSGPCSVLQCMAFSVRWLLLLWSSGL